MFEQASDIERLDKTDADFVDVGEMLFITMLGLLINYFKNLFYEFSTF